VIAMSHHESVAAGSQARLVDRMVFFSDAVFAIVLTLLVLELRPPHVAPGGDLWPALWIIRHAFVSFALSFGLVAIFWPPTCP
jgi:uncharacterized membrane protein